MRAGVEECDDQNTVNTDRCLNNCKTARCGDGALCNAAACTSGPTGAAEQCDAGTANSDTTPNACRTDCAAPKCGDGVVDNGEDCDEGADNGTPGSTCSAACKAPAQCGVTVRMTSTEKLGALKFELDYKNAAGEFAGSGLTVQCTSTLTGSSYTFFDDDTNRLLRESIIALAGFTGPTDLATCTFATTAGDPVPQDFVITVTDASTLDLEPASPTVVISSISCGTGAAMVAMSAAACPLQPDETCADATRSSLLVRRDLETTRASLRWLWRGERFADEVFGDPASRTDYALCLYDSSRSRKLRAAEWFFPSDPAWKHPTAGGWRLRYAAGDAASASSVRLRPDVDGASLIRMEDNVSDLAEILLADPPNWGSTRQFTVQMRESDGMCWSADIGRIVRGNQDLLRIRER